MLIITRNIIVDRISNRRDNVVDILGSLAGSWLQMRCLVHQMCFGFLHGQSFGLPCAGGTEFKRATYEPTTSSAATPTLWRYRLAATATRPSVSRS